MLIHPNFDSGGAETQIKQLLPPLSRAFCVHMVLVGKRGQEFRAFARKNPAVRFYLLAHQIKRFRRVRTAIRLFLLVRQISPQVMLSFLAHTNILSLLIGRLTGSSKVIWGLRTSDFRQGEFGIKGDLIHVLSFWLARYANALISNNATGLKQYQIKAHTPKKTFVVPNGINSTLFQKRPDIRSEYRRVLNLSDEIVIGTVARIVPWKGYEMLLQAARTLIASGQRLRLVFAGSGDPSYETHLKKIASNLGVGDYITWLGDRNDIAQLMNSFDIFVLCSDSGEGFSNALSEAMLVEQPVIATDVGDSANIVGDAGIIIPPGDSEQLVKALRQLITNSDDRVRLGKMGRSRIEANFSVTVCADRFITAIRQVL